MYIPQHFEEPRIEVMHALMRDYPLATLVAVSSQGLNANHIPLQLHADLGTYGTLRGHIARANPMLNDIAGDTEVLAVFQGPQSYISPNWYPSKRINGKVVPTWNYTAVHAYGELRFIDDPAWVRQQVDSLTTQHEGNFEKPWEVADAPSEFIDRMLAAIVGIEIKITRLQGKWKVSQNQSTENRQGVIAGLKESAESEESEAMAELVASAMRPLP